MREGSFITWLRTYLKSMRTTKDKVLIEKMLSEVEDTVQTNPYWTTVSTTNGSSDLNYTVVTNSQTNTYSVTNYSSNENR